MGLFGPKIIDPYNTMGGQSVQRQARGQRGREDQVKRLLEMRRDMDRGRVTEAQLIAEVRKSTGLEVNAAMDDFGGSEKWNGQ